MNDADVHFARSVKLQFQRWTIDVILSNAGLLPGIGYEGILPGFPQKEGRPVVFWKFLSGRNSRLLREG